MSNDSSNPLPIRNQSTAPPGFDSVKLHIMELGPEIEVMAGYALRLSRVTVKPGAFFAPHSHKNQPEIIYVVEGSLTEQRNLEPEREHGPGSVLILTKEITHSLANNTSSPVVYISTSVKA